MIRPRFQLDAERLATMRERRDARIAKRKYKGSTKREKEKAERLARAEFVLCLRREGYTLEQVAQRIGLTKERARQIEQWAQVRADRLNAQWIVNLQIVERALRGK